MNISVLTFDTLDSTNSEALRQAKVGAKEGLCIVAGQQTAGRGRQGRTWVSEKDAGLYFSIVLRPAIEVKYLPLITLMAGVAVHETLSDLGLSSDIKWVNDVLVNERKICGILAETTETADGLAVVVGIGINVRSSNFPPEIADIATSVEDEIAKQNSHAIEPLTQVVDALPDRLAHFYRLLGSADGPANIIDEWRLRSTYFAGKHVRVTTGGDVVIGVTDGLESNGALRLRQEDGSVVIIQAGDVERVRPEH